MRQGARIRIFSVGTSIGMMQWDIIGKEGSDNRMAIDADAMLAAYTERLYLNKTPDEVVALKARKRHSETVALCQAMIVNETWKIDPNITETHVYLCYATALEGLTRRYEAIELLEHALSEYLPQEPSLLLALARLLFKAGGYDRALDLCLQVCACYPKDTRCSANVAADAYHLAGWVKIHDDDHTGAYRLWSKGSTVVPHSNVLLRQHHKRLCWDHDEHDMHDVKGLVGAGATPPFAVDAFATSSRTRAHHLFHRDQTSLVFRTQAPLLTADECANILDIVNDFHRDKKWGTVRHASIKTTDVAVEDIVVLRPWLKKLLQTRVYPLLHQVFPQLADGSSMQVNPVMNLTEENCHRDPHYQPAIYRCRVHDAFIVRYDADDESLSLPGHNDTSLCSIVLSLNREGDAFSGGGTWFQALDRIVDADIGCAVAFAGLLRHAGASISRGTRMILVLFIYVEDFAYGQYLRQHDVNSVNSTQEERSKHVDASHHSSFVVYNQTVELVNTLNQGSGFVIDAGSGE
jgi:hypothetical protein